MNPADQQRLRQWFGQASILSMVCLSMTAPAIIIFAALPYFTVEQMLIPLIIVVYAWLLLADIARPIRVNGMFFLGAVFFVCNILSIAYGATVLGNPLDYRDFYELPKAWLPVAFFTIAYEADLSESSLRRLFTAVSCAVLLVCLYAWGQFLGLGFTYRLNAYYSGGEHIDRALDYARRVYATMGNANVLGELMTWCVVLFVVAAILGAASRLLLGFAALACLVALVMTGSRYGIVTLALGLMWIVASKPFAGRRTLPNLAFALLFAAVAVFTYQSVAASNVRTLQRYQTLRDPLQIDSLRERVGTLWPPAWADFSKSPVFGQGPGKSFLWVTGGVSTYLDSEFLKVLREQGVLGFVAFLGYYLYPLYLLRNGQRAARFLSRTPIVCRVPANLAVLHAAFIIGVLALVMNIGMATFYMPRLQGFLWLWLGLGARAAATVREFSPISKTSALHQLVRAQEVGSL